LKTGYFLKTTILDQFRPFFEQKWGHDQGGFGGNRGVEIDRNAIKNQRFLWFCATSALKKNTTTVWANKACLFVNVNSARKMQKQSIM